MLTVMILKSSRTREKKALVREKTEAETLLQTEWADSPQEMLKLSLSTSKVLLSLEKKLARLKTANDKVDRSPRTRGKYGSSGTVSEHT